MLYFAVFLIVFALSAFMKFRSLMGIGGSGYSLQGEDAKGKIYTGEIKKEIIPVSYISDEGKVEERPVIICRPADVSGDLPLIYVPHYSIDESAADFQEYMAQGWAAASPTEFKNEYNGKLVSDDLVFNNAALYMLRHKEGVDQQRIAVVGGSAGGYMAMMLSELQMGVCATIANSPITNVYYNFAVHFPQCDKVNGNSGAFDFPIPIQGMVSKMFRPINHVFDGADDPRWEALSPVSMARCVSNPMVVNHYTGDILVPVDQITKRYSYVAHDGTLPGDFQIRLGSDYPGILSHSLEEEADPVELTVARYALQDQHVDMDMPYSGKLLTINILDDGPMSAKGSHTAPGTTGSMDTIPFLTEMFSRTLAETERAVPEKLRLLLERYCGKSSQLPAHEGVNDTIYGSLAVCRQEILEEMSQFAVNHSFAELDNAVNAAIEGSDDPSRLSAVWAEIADQIGRKP